MRFSVIIPLYNKSSYVAKAIGSVVSQTFADYELIIMDDGSSDDSYDIALKTIDGYDNYHIYHQKNAGVSLARNNAVTLSQGEYLCFLDADDWWDPNFLEKMSELIEAYPEAGIYGTGYVIVNETKKKTRMAPIGVEQGFEKGYINYYKVYAKTLAMPLWTGAVCIPRVIFDEMEGFPRGIKLGEDFLLWIKIALKYKVAFLNIPLAYYNQDSDPEWRGVGRLIPPENHMIWHLQDVVKDENSESNYKVLIDKLRVYGLFPFYLSHEYHESARHELAKVDWSQQPFKTKCLYKTPIFFLRIRHRLLTLGSRIKQKLVKHL